MPKGKPKKSDENFFNEHIDFFYDHGEKLKELNPECSDEYNDHSLLKLISIKYWVDIFTPIAHRQLGDKHGYTIAYVDSMAGSGITLTKRAKDYLCGSTPSVLISAKAKNFPFNYIIVNEIDQTKTAVLKKRIRKITSNKLKIFNNDILNVSDKIAKFIEKKTISFIVIDPQGFKGVTWKALKPLFSSKGDSIITWFETDAWRLKNAALTEKDHKAASGDYNRLCELFGSEEWIHTKSPSELTKLFVKRVLYDCKKSCSENIIIKRTSGQYFKMILFLGTFPEAKHLAKQWKDNLERRFQSHTAKHISTLLDVKAGRKTSLDTYL